MFGTNDVIYVPENHFLVFDDVYHWKRYKLDVRHFGVRIRPGAFEEVKGRMTAALDLVKASPRFTEIFPQVNRNSEQILRDLTGISGHAHGKFENSLDDIFRGGTPGWWIQMSDLPAESFFEDDYEREVESEASSAPYFTFGSVKVAQLDGLEVQLSGEGEDELPFVIDVPDEGLTRWTIPATEPIPLVHEFCGSHGVSAFGKTTNIDTYGNIAEHHQFCTPIGRVGEKAFATLYFHYSIPSAERVVSKIADELLFPIADVLEK